MELDCGTTVVKTAEWKHHKWPYSDVVAELYSNGNIQFKIYNLWGFGTGHKDGSRADVAVQGTLQLKLMLPTDVSDDELKNLVVTAYDSNNYHRDPNVRAFDPEAARRRR